ncbi:glycosyltransferase family 2 protein [Carboxylicivirga sp. A043]|uniref:glycosyltransferase family 2 protein n=1 Tax=Carboxylicivirga litoralis TaxID=2816963 RepID=UPI0021CAF190|nr:glycosyltransferase family 2 protein [Carboxylicivirga sp. A043]MCU4158053.1 glycosyltransferase family 2 protein [Carboxylicivirga sp. A043]
MNPLVSVIIPNYNRENYIEQCMQSVVEQSYRPIELIIVDDGSSDNSIGVIKAFQSKFKDTTGFDIKLLEQRNSGAPRARNYGFEQSNGEFIMWLDSDDLLLPHKIESQINAFTKETDVVYSRAQFFNETPDKLMDEYWGRAPQGNSSDYFEFPWQTMCALYKRSAIQKYGMWKEHITFNQDWEFSMRYLILSSTFFLDNISSLFRQHEGDRIGKKISIDKIKSLSTILFDIYQLSFKHKLIDYYLIKRYRSRLMYCAIQYAALGAKFERKQLFNQLAEYGLSNIQTKIVKLISYKYLNTFILKK